MGLSFVESRVSLDLLFQRSGCRGEQEAQHYHGSSGYSASVRLILAAATFTEAVSRKRSLCAQMLVDPKDRPVLRHTEGGKYASRCEGRDSVRADQPACLLLPLRAQ